MIRVLPWLRSKVQSPHSLGSIAGIQVSIEDSRVYNAGNGLVDQSVRDVNGNMRMFQHSRFASFGKPWEGYAAVMIWLQSGAALGINLARRPSCWRSAWSIRHGRECRKPIASFGETVLWKDQYAVGAWLRWCRLGLSVTGLDNIVDDEKKGPVRVQGDGTEAAAERCVLA